VLFAEHEASAHPIDSDSDRNAKDCKLSALEVPIHPSILRDGSDGATPRLVLARRGASRQKTAPVLEPIHTADGPALLMLSPPAARVRVNGLAVPAVSVLRVADQLQIEDHALVHVSEYETFDIRRPTGDELGRPCGVCMLEFTADTWVHVCGCNEARHCEGEEKPPNERLVCALMGPCARCGRQTATTPGHRYVPEV